MIIGIQQEAQILKNNRANLFFGTMIALLLVDAKKASPIVDRLNTIVARSLI